MYTPLLLCLSALLQVGQLHGDMTPLERAAVLDAARKGAFQLLLVSDVAARGIDMPQVRQWFPLVLIKHPGCIAL
jgi:superfamily II DNA/RNA helicase